MLSLWKYKCACRNIIKLVVRVQSQEMGQKHLCRSITHKTCSNSSPLGGATEQFTPKQADTGTISSQCVTLMNTEQQSLSGTIPVVLQPVVHTVYITMSFPPVYNISILSRKKYLSLCTICTSISQYKLCSVELLLTFVIELSYISIISLPLCATGCHFLILLLFVSTRECWKPESNSSYVKT